MSIDIDVETLGQDTDKDIITAFEEFNEDVLRELIDFVFTALYLSQDTELSVAVVGEEEMERIHLEWMNLPGSTDVMSFPMDEMSPGTHDQLSKGVLGDIILCPPVAARQAQQAGHSTMDEFCLLTVHGILHCLGYDHATPEEEQEMFGIQRKILENFLGRSAPVETRF